MQTEIDKEEIEKNENSYWKLNSILANLGIPYIFKTVESSYISLEDINEGNAMFPFEYKIIREMIAIDDKYHITEFEGEPVIVLSKWMRWV